MPARARQVYAAHGRCGLSFILTNTMHRGTRRRLPRYAAADDRWDRCASARSRETSPTIGCTTAEFETKFRIEDGATP